MDKISRIGMDTSKQIFQLHGVDEAERVVLRGKLKRREVLEFFGKLEPTVVGIEACGGSHYWARELRRLGHEVKLIAPQFVKPYVKRGKNDAADAEALCEAMSRPTMRFVPVKSAESQAALMLAGLRDGLCATARSWPTQSAATPPSSDWLPPRDKPRSSRCCRAFRQTRRCRSWRASCSPSMPRNTRSSRLSSRRSTPS